MAYGETLGCSGFSPKVEVSPGGMALESVIDPTSLETLFGLPDELAWQDRALCAQTDPEAFFPEKGGSTREGKKICANCEVKNVCLEYALVHNERFGIWGGLSERERRALQGRAV